MKRFYQRFLAIFFALLFTAACTVTAEAGDFFGTDELSKVTTEVDTSDALTMAVAAEDYSGGGWAMVTATQSVRSANSSNASVIGTVYAGEGITVLTQYGSNVYIEYSTSSGAKRGYLIGAKMDGSFLSISRVGLVNTTSTVYYGANTSTYQAAGTVYAGEYVAVLGIQNGWVCVEYNTSSGRKRGYMLMSALTTYGSNALDGFYNANVSVGITSSMNVRSGPSSQYPVIGSVGNETIKVGRIFLLYGTYAYIEYDVTGTGQKKSGYIPY